MVLDTRMLNNESFSAALCLVPRYVVLRIIYSGSHLQVIAAAEASRAASESEWTNFRLGEEEDLIGQLSRFSQSHHKWPF